MLDLETLGTRPGCVVLSIAATQFDLDGRVGASFYANIDPQSCIDAKLTVDPKTKQWWSEQSADAQRALINDRKPLREVVERFNEWFYKAGGPCPWGHGASFDPPIWEAAAVAAGSAPPWKFWNIRDTRTVFDLFDFDTRDIIRKGVYHNAFDDARHQIDCVVAALRKGRPAASASVFS